MIGYIHFSFRKAYWALSGLLLLGMSSCSKHNNPGTAPMYTCLQYIHQDTALSLYALALQRAGMTTDSTFTSGGPFTLFAPQDSAFIQAGLTQPVINSMNTSRLRSMLQYGILQGRISAQDLTGAYTEQVTSYNPAYQPTLTKNYYGIFLNGVPAVKTDNNLGDGVIQETGRMVIPPTGTLLQEVDSLPELSFLACALRRNAFLRKGLQLANPFFDNDVNQIAYYGITLLAPTNSAFQTFGFADTTAIAVADSAYMTQLLGAYLFAGTFYTSDFKGGVEFVSGIYPYLPISFGGSFALLPDGITFASSANIAHTVQIIKPDVVATNGVLDEINYILIPSNN